MLSVAPRPDRVERKEGKLNIRGRCGDCAKVKASVNSHNIVDIRETSSESLFQVYRQSQLDRTVCIPDHRGLHFRLPPRHLQMPMSPDQLLHWKPQEMNGDFADNIQLYR